MEMREGYTNSTQPTIEGKLYLLGYIRRKRDQDFCWGEERKPEVINVQLNGVVNDYILLVNDPSV